MTYSLIEPKQCLEWPQNTVEKMLHRCKQQVWIESLVAFTYRDNALPAQLLALVDKSSRSIPTILRRFRKQFF